MGVSDEATAGLTLGSLRWWLGIVNDEDKRQTPQHTAITQHGTIAIIVLIAIVLMHHNNSHLGVLPRSAALPQGLSAHLPLPPLHIM